MLHPAAHHHRSSRWRRLRRRVLAASVGGLFVCSIFLFSAWTLSRAAPTWWRTVQREDPGTIRLATIVENTVVNSAYHDWPVVTIEEGLRRSEPWTLSVDATEVNAWLNVRLPKWLANQKEQFRWPQDVSDIQVEFHDDRITLGARVRAGDRHQVLTATLTPRLDEHGRLYLPARSVNLGRLNIPASWVLQPIRDNAEDYIPPQLRRLPETEALFRAFGGKEALVQRATVRLDDGRRIRILGITPRGGRLLITCQTER